MLFIMAAAVAAQVDEVQFEPETPESLRLQFYKANAQAEETQEPATFEAVNYKPDSNAWLEAYNKNKEKRLAE